MNFFETLTAEEAVNVLLLLLAGIASGLIVKLHDFWKEKEQQDYDNRLIINTCLSLLSSQWKFLEEVSEELFTCEDTELQEALHRLLQGALFMEDIRMTFIDNAMRILAEHGYLEAEIVMYSRTTLSRDPYLFRALPLWKKDECETHLRLCEKNLDHQSGIKEKVEKEKGIELVRVRKTNKQRPHDDGHKKKKKKTLVWSGLKALGAFSAFTLNGKKMKRVLCTKARRRRAFYFYQ